MMQESLAERLRVLRARRGLNLTDAATRIGVTRHTLAALERGQEPHFATLAKLAEGYGVPVEELLEAEESVPVPLGQASESARRAEETQTGPKTPQEEPLLSRPEIDDWLIEQGHMDREAFLSWAEELADVEEIEQAIAELHETRDSILDDLRNDEVRSRLFGPAQTEGITGDDWTREVFRPIKMARRLANEIRREYTARELGLVNYSRVLFVEGATDDYLVREQDPDSEYVRERHTRLLEARQVAARKLEESYEKALAL